jgi:siroheme synthase
MVDYALNYGHVVRLKGGDPFVFGRGHEELDFAAEYNIPTQVIPGISSSIGVPGLQGIPVTHRGLSESFWVVTGTTSDGKYLAGYLCRRQNQCYRCSTDGHTQAWPKLQRYLKTKAKTNCLLL